MKRVLMVFALLLCCGAKNVEWKTGVLESANREGWVSSGSASTNGTLNPSTGTYNSTTMQSNWNHVTYYVTFRDAEYEYFAERTLSFRWQHDPQFTENAPVKYTIDGKKVVLVDDKGKEFKMSLAKRRKL